MSYTKDQIVVKSDIEHIRSNPELYIGSTENPTHLLIETLDNALDEVLAGYAKNIGVIIKGEEITIVDDGRGIPTDYNKEYGLEIPFLISTIARSSGKFQDKNSAYKISAGLHGLGLVAVAALSEYLVFKIIRNGYYYEFEIRDAKPTNKEKQKVGKDKRNGTAVIFKPDKKYFEKNELDYDLVLRKLAAAQFELKDRLNRIVFRVNDTSIKIPNYVEITLGEDITCSDDVFHVSSKNKEEKIDLYFKWDLDVLDNLSKPIDKPKSMLFSSIVNIIPVSEGTHKKYITKIIKDTMFNEIKKLDKDKVIKKEDIEKGLRIFCVLELVEKHFSSQDKKALKNRESYYEKFKIKTKVEKAIKESKDIVEKVYESLFNWRVSLASKKLKSSTKKIKRNLNIPNLKDCLSTKRDECSLFIVEGRSAGGTLLEIVDRKKHAVFYLKGKPLNVETSSVDKLFKNKEISTLIESIGVGARIGNKKEDLSKIRYKDIIILADADEDGKHIILLLVLALSKLMPSVIKNGYVKVAHPPLYGAKNKKTREFIPIYDPKDLENYPENKYIITRFKGLGEMNASDLEVILFKKPNMTTLNLNDDDIEELVKIMSSNMEFRRRIMEEQGLIKIIGGNK